MTRAGTFVAALAVVAAMAMTASAAQAQGAKLAGRNVKIGCQVSLTGKGAE